MEVLWATVHKQLLHNILQVAVCACVCARMRAYMRACMCACLCMCMCACVPVCMCVHMCMSACIHIHVRKSMCAHTFLHGYVYALRKGKREASAMTPNAEHASDTNSLSASSGGASWSASNAESIGALRTEMADSHPESPPPADIVATVR